MVDIAVRIRGEMIEDVRLEGVRGFHNEGIEIEPPEPIIISLRAIFQIME